MKHDFQTLPATALGPLALGGRFNAQQLVRMRERLTEELQRRRVFFGANLLSTFVLPYFIPADTLASWTALSETVLAAAERFARSALQERTRYDFLKLNPLAEELVRVDPGYHRIIPIARPDAVVGANGPTFIELNCDCPSMMTYADMVSECLLALPELEPVRERVVPERRTEHLLDTLLECYREYGGAVWPPTIAIADWEGRDARFEDQAIAERFRAAGYPTMVCDLRALRRVGAHLEIDGRAVQIVYRRASFRELLSRHSEIEPFLEAYRDGVVCVINPLRSYVASSKALLAGICEESLGAGCLQTSKEAPPPILAKTMIIHPSLENQLRLRGPWVLKRAESSCANHVLLPDLASETDWAEALANARHEVWVAQEARAISTLEMPSADGSGGNQARLERLFYIWNPFLFGGRYGGSFVCASPSPLVNHNKGGSVIPTVPYR